MSDLLFTVHQYGGTDLTGNEVRSSKFELGQLVAAATLGLS